MEDTNPQPSTLTPKPESLLETGSPKLLSVAPLPAAATALLLMILFPPYITLVVMMMCQATTSGLHPNQQAAKFLDPCDQGQGGFLGKALSSEASYTQDLL